MKDRCLGGPPVNWLQLVHASLSLRGGLNLGKHSGCRVKSAEQRGIFTSPGCAPAHTAQDAVGLFHRASTQPCSPWPLSLQPVIPLLSPWVFLEDVCKICFLLSPVMMTFQNVSEQPCSDIGLVSQNPWVHSVWSHALLRADFTYVAPDLISIHCCFFSWASAS